MNTRISFAALVIAGFLAAPVVAAGWSSDGSSEPDTVFDEDGSMMYTQPPLAGTRQVYFNAYTTSSAVLSQGLNPNVPALDSNIEPFGQEEQWAILGVWTDCNKDGYIGMAEGAMREYPAVLLPAGHGCPALTGGTATCWTNPGTGNPCPEWPVTGANNHKGWVTELIPITNNKTALNSDRRLIYDAKAAVWGDYGQPDDPAAIASGGTCPISPLPRGTMRSSGGLLTYADCSTGLLEAANLLSADSYRLLGQTLPGPGDPLGLRFQDDDNGTSNPTFGGVGTFGDDHSDNAIVRTGDCSEDPIVPGSSLPGDFRHSGGIRAPDVDYLNTNGNIAGTVNYTMETLPLPNRNPSPEVGPQSTSNCDFKDDRGQDVYTAEGDFNSVSNTNKAESDWNFEFQRMSRGGIPLGTPIGVVGPPVGITGGPAGAANDAGVPLLSGYAGEGPSQWFGGSVNVAKVPQTVVTRGTLAEGDLAVDIARAYWLSFYAVVQTDRYSVPTPAGLRYGADQCGAAESGVVNGWQCDPDEWNRNPDGSLVPDPFGSLAKPGKVYNLRDVDCYDGGNNLGVGVQPAFYGGANCRAG